MVNLIIYRDRLHCNLVKSADFGFLRRQEVSPFASLMDFGFPAELGIVKSADFNFPAELGIV